VASPALKRYFFATAVAALVSSLTRYRESPVVCSPAVRDRVATSGQKTGFPAVTVWVGG
jgi:hypothetical protein